MRTMFVSIDSIGDPVCYQLPVELPCLLSQELAPTLFDGDESAGIQIGYAPLTLNRRLPGFREGFPYVSLLELCNRKRNLCVS